MILTRQVTVGTSAVRLDSTASATNGSDCLIKNVDTGTLWIGDSAVTISNGFRLLVNEFVVIHLERNEAVYGISDVASSPCHVVEVGQG